MEDKQIIFIIPPQKNKKDIYFISIEKKREK